MNSSTSFKNQATTKYTKAIDRERTRELNQDGLANGYFIALEDRSNVCVNLRAVPGAALARRFN